MTLTSATSTQAVLDHHLQCFGARDVPGILADFAQDARIFTPTGVLRGAESMTSLFQGFFAEFAKPGARLDLQVQLVDGDVAYIIWTAETADNTYELGTDTFVVRDGKILVQTYAAKVTPKARHGVPIAAEQFGLWHTNSAGNPGREGAGPVPMGVPLSPMGVPLSRCCRRACGEGA